MTASYVLALQLILAGLISTRMSVGDASDLFAICHTDQGSPEQGAADEGKAPVGVAHVKCAVCALASFSPPPASFQHFTFADLSAARIEGWTFEAQLAGADGRHYPKSSQGPPATV